jgi:hypothetical protein
MAHDLWINNIVTSQGVYATNKRVLDWMIGFIDILYTALGATGNTALSLFYSFYSLTLHTCWCFQSSVVVSWQRIHNSLTVTAAHMKSSLDSQIPFSSFLLNHLRLPYFQFSAATDNSGTRLSSIPLLPSSYPGRLASRNSTNSNDLCPFYNPTARTTKKTAYVLLRRRVYSVVA